MPQGKRLARYKVVRCRKCGRIIKRFDRSKYVGWHVPPDVILTANRRHYKNYHPKAFKESIKKGVKSRKKG